MLKKLITFEDFHGQRVSEYFYFNLTKAEIVKMELGVSGGLADALRTIIDTKDNARIIEQFERFIIDAYGVKSEDGRRFIKSDELRQEFLQMDAYSVLFMELVSDAEAASAFMKGIIPVSLLQELETHTAEDITTPTA
jgi:hypothetical protein